MTESIITRYDTFARVELPEGNYEGLLADLAPKIFPNAVWFEFKPPIRSVHGVAHPDALVVAEDGSEWWVVEVELARHSLRDHVELQLTKLRDGWYTREAMDYVTTRYPSAKPLTDKLNLSAPQFLLLLDEVSAPIERVARHLDFEVLHILPFRSGKQLDAVAVQGSDRARKRVRASGVLLTPQPSLSTVTFRLTRADSELPKLQTEVLVGSRLVRLFGGRDGRGFTIALGYAELVSTIGEAEYYVLTYEPNEPLRITTMPTSGGA